MSEVNKNEIRKILPEIKKSSEQYKVKLIINLEQYLGTGGTKCEV